MKCEPPQDLRGLTLTSEDHVIRAGFRRVRSHPLPPHLLIFGLFKNSMAGSGTQVAVP